MNMYKKIISSAVLCLAVIAIANCGGKLTNPNNSSKTYAINAVMVKDIETGDARIDIILTKNDSSYTDADITLGGVAIPSDMVKYYKLFDSSDIHVGSDYTLVVSDSGLSILSTTISMPGEVVITEAGYRNFQGSAEPVAWTGGSGANGYILATVPPTSSGADGYAVYTGILSGTIPAEAFVLNINNWISGVHNIYVAAYTGAPIDNSMIPFDLPSTGKPSDNISINSISGRVSGVVISIPDTMNVAK